MYKVNHTNMIEYMNNYLIKLEKELQDIKDIQKRDGLSHLTGPQMVKLSEINTVKHLLKVANEQHD